MLLVSALLAMPFWPCRPPSHGFSKQQFVSAAPKNTTKKGTLRNAPNNKNQKHCKLESSPTQKQLHRGLLVRPNFSLLLKFCFSVVPPLEARWLWSPTFDPLQIPKRSRCLTHPWSIRQSGRVLYLLLPAVFPEDPKGRGECEASRVGEVVVLSVARTRSPVLHSFGICCCVEEVKDVRALFATERECPEWFYFSVFVYSFTVIPS